MLVSRSEAVSLFMIVVCLNIRLRKNLERVISIRDLKDDKMSESPCHIRYIHVVFSLHEGEYLVMELYYKLFMKLNNSKSWQQHAQTEHSNRII